MAPTWASSPRNEPKKTPRVFGMTITVRAYEGGREGIESFAKVHRWILSLFFFNCGDISVPRGRSPH